MTDSIKVGDAVRFYTSQSTGRVESVADGKAVVRWDRGAVRHTTVRFEHLCVIQMRRRVKAG